MSPQGHFIPPGFHAARACEFYAVLHYKGADEKWVTSSAVYWVSSSGSRT